MRKQHKYTEEQKRFLTEKGDIFTKVSNVLGAVNRANKLAFSPDGMYLAVIYNFGASAPYFVDIYKRSGDVFTKLPNPTELPIESAKNMAFSPDGIYLAASHSISPFVTINKSPLTDVIQPANLKEALETAQVNKNFRGLGFTQEDINAGEIATIDILFK